MDVTSMSVSELLRTYRMILAELRRRSVVRTWNAPTGDYAEYLMAGYFGVSREVNSRKSVDLITKGGQGVQVKARVVEDRARRGDRQLSTIRTWDFECLAIVLFAGDYSVFRAALVPRDVAAGAKTRSQHVNGDTVYATDDLLDAPGVVDITQDLRGLTATTW